MDFNEIGWISVDWIDVAQDRDNCWAVAIAVMNRGGCGSLLE
jgi:hypothetical protein